MALSVTLTGDSPAVSYRMQVKKINIGYDRNPIEAPVPGGVPIILDLGQYRANLSIEGIVTSSQGSDGAFTIPSKNDLEDSVLDWYDNDITVAIDITGSADSYKAKLRNLNFELVSGRDDNWDYRMVFNIEGRT